MTTTAMHHDIHICPDCDLGVVHLSGGVNLQGLCDVLNALLDCADWRPGCPMVWDVRQVTDLYITPAAQRRLAALADELKISTRGMRAALLTRTTSQKAYGIEMLRAMGGEEFVHRAFQSKRRALRWIRSAGNARDHSACGPKCPVERSHDHTLSASTSPSRTSS